MAYHGLKKRATVIPVEARDKVARRKEESVIGETSDVVFAVARSACNSKLVLPGHNIM
jgi:hypothetical protein